MKDIVNSFKAHMYERTSSPLLGAFIFYWIIFNYKFLIVLFSDLKPIEKFNEISTNVYPSWIEQYGCGLALPIIVTLLYILYFPKISNKIHEKWIEHQNELKEISNKRVLTYEEYGDLQRRFTELELSFDETFSKKDNEIINLKKSIDKKEELNNQTKELHMKQMEELHNEYKKELNQLEEKNKKLNKMIKDKTMSKYVDLDKNNNLINNPLLDVSQYHLLEYIGENPKNTTSQLIDSFNQKRIEIDNACDELLLIGFLEVNSTFDNGDRVFRITDKGRKYLLSEVPF